jgi:hypothetical protein
MTSVNPHKYADDALTDYLAACSTKRCRWPA